MTFRPEYTSDIRIRPRCCAKQIEALVKTIQADTNEAVISMEQTTTEGVNGAKRAQDAGVALEEIEHCDCYDYCLRSASRGEDFENLQAIYRAEKMRNR